jgi:hypothetical protein
MNEKNIRASRGKIAAANGLNIALAMTQTRACFSGYLLPANNVSKPKAWASEVTYDLPNACQILSRELSIAILDPLETDHYH